MRRLATPLLAAVLLLAAAPASEARLRKGIWGPVTVQGASQFDRYRGLGVDIFNFQLVWANVARSRPADPRNPNDPAYVWPANVDAAAAESARTGIELSLLVRGTPSWANGGQNETFRPKRARDFANFVHAASRRYRSVRLWQIWGEPNGGTYQWQPRRSAARHYADLLDAAYVQLKRRSRRNRVIGGMTQSGRDGTGQTPATWVRVMRTSSGRRPRMDMFGHNPFQQARRPRLRDGQKTPGWRDMSDLDTFIREIDRYHRRAKSNRKLPIYLSEWSVWSDRPGPSNWFVSQAVQASWLRSGFRIAKANRRVFHLGWFRLQDGERDGFGLMDQSFNPKPAYEAFARQ